MNITKFCFIPLADKVFEDLAFSGQLNLNLRILYINKSFVFLQKSKIVDRETSVQRRFHERA